MIHGFFQMGSRWPRPPPRRWAGPSTTSSGRSAEVSPRCLRGRPGRPPARRSRTRWRARARANRPPVQPTMSVVSQSSKPTTNPATNATHGEAEEAVAHPLAERDPVRDAGPLGQHRIVAHGDQPARSTSDRRSSSTRACEKCRRATSALCSSSDWSGWSRKARSGSGSSVGNQRKPKRQQLLRPPGTARPRPACGAAPPRSGGCRTPPTCWGRRRRRLRRRRPPSSRAAVGGGPVPSRRRAARPAPLRSRARPGRAASRCRRPRQSARGPPGCPCGRWPGPGGRTGGRRRRPPARSRRRGAVTGGRVDVEAVVDGGGLDAPLGELAPGEVVDGDVAPGRVVGWELV